MSITIFFQQCIRAVFLLKDLKCPLGESKGNMHRLMIGASGRKVSRLHGCHQSYNICMSMRAICQAVWGVRAMCQAVWGEGQK